MTNKEAVKGVMKIWTGYTTAYAEVSHEDVEAYKMAIEALSKQSASSEQVDKSVIVDFVAFQREWLNSHKTLELDAVNNALVNIFLKTTGKAFIDSLGQSAENDEDRTRDDEGPKLFGKRTIIEPGEEFIGEDLLKEALDQSADSDKMVKLKKRTITERLIIAESLIYSVIADSDQFREDAKKTEDVPDMNVGKTDGDTISRQAAIDAINETIARYVPYLTRKTSGIPLEVALAIKRLPSAQPEIIRCNSCKHWTQTTGKMKGYGLGRCDYLDADLVTCNGFCYWAERRNDG